MDLSPMFLVHAIKTLREDNKRINEDHYKEMMSVMLGHYSQGGKNVIIFRNGVSARLGSWEREENFHFDGARYNAYVGASGLWQLKSDGGWKNWAFKGNYDRHEKNVVFK